MKTSRPTAVNLFEAADRLSALTHSAAAASEPSATAQSVVRAYLHAAEAMLERDIADNKSIGKFGAEYILSHIAATPSDETTTKTDGKEDIRIITHCNTGSLATAGFGTALGIIRHLHSNQSLAHVYCTETRPYNQGGRLTAYELVYEGIPSTLITDSMVSALLKQKKISAIVVGADR